MSPHVSTPRSLSIVIPALNERENLPALMAGLPLAELAAAGWSTEVIIVDNGSEDGTGQLAAELGATVVDQPVRGYGNAYAAGFDAARGDVIATGDADLTYPFDHLPQLLAELVDGGVDFLTTDRLHRANAAAMKFSHAVGNAVLSVVSRTLFGSRYRDSQSGMWIFRREVWAVVDTRSGGMAFSQEIKNEAWRCGFTCREVPIEYRPRGGEVKLNAARDGIANLTQLFTHRFRRPVDPAPSVAATKGPAMDVHPRSELGLGPVGLESSEAAVAAPDGEAFSVDEPDAAELVLDLRVEGTEAGAPGRAG